MLNYIMPKHFSVQEYVSPSLYKRLGNKAILHIDYRVIKTDDSLREFFDVPIFINTWSFSPAYRKKYGLKIRKYSGYREIGDPFYSRDSQHSDGRASDKIVYGINASKLRKIILENQSHFPYITVIEDKVSWLHTDCRVIINQGIQLINP